MLAVNINRLHSTRPNVHMKHMKTKGWSEGRKSPRSPPNTVGVVGGRRLKLPGQVVESSYPIRLAMSNTLRPCQISEFKTEHERTDEADVGLCLQT